MNPHPVAFIVAGLVAFIASSIEMANQYRVSPFARYRFTIFWLLIALLDAGAGVVSVWIVRVFDLQKSETWLWSGWGYVFLGVTAALLVRANLLSIRVNRWTIPLGFGVIYGSVRSLLEIPLNDEHWEISDADKWGRQEWVAQRADELGSNLSFSRVASSLNDYSSRVLKYRDSSFRMSQVEHAIAKASENPMESDKIKELLTFMCDRSIISPMNRLLGRPSRAVRHSWREAPSEP